jgi:hypothetical protein
MEETGPVKLHRLEPIRKQLYIHLPGPQGFKQYRTTLHLRTSEQSEQVLVTLPIDLEVPKSELVTKGLEPASYTLISSSDIHCLKRIPLAM